MSWHPVPAGMQTWASLLQCSRSPPAVSPIWPVHTTVWSSQHHTRRRKQLFNSNLGISGSSNIVFYKHLMWYVGIDDFSPLGWGQRSSGTWIAAGVCRFPEFLAPSASERNPATCRATSQLKYINAATETQLINKNRNAHNQ